MNKSRVWVFVWLLAAGLFGGFVVADMLEFEDPRMIFGTVVGYAILNTIAVYVTVAIWQSMVKWLRN